MSLNTIHEWDFCCTNTCIWSGYVDSLGLSSTATAGVSLPLITTTPKPSTPFQADSKTRPSELLRYNVINWLSWDTCTISNTDSREGYSKGEISLLVVVMVGSFLLILSSFFILTISLIVVVRYQHWTKNEISYMSFFPKPSISYAFLVQLPHQKHITVVWSLQYL